MKIAMTTNDFGALIHTGTQSLKTYVVDIPDSLIPSAVWAFIRGELDGSISLSLVKETSQPSVSLVKETSQPSAGDAKEPDRTCSICGAKNLYGSHCGCRDRAK